MVRRHVIVKYDHQLSPVSYAVLRLQERDSRHAGRQLGNVFGPVPDDLHDVFGNGLGILFFDAARASACIGTALNAPADAARPAVVPVSGLSAGAPLRSARAVDRKSGRRRQVRDLFLVREEPLLQFPDPVAQRVQLVLGAVLRASHLAPGGPYNGHFRQDPPAGAVADLLHERREDADPAHDLTQLGLPRVFDHLRQVVRRYVQGVLSALRSTKQHQVPQVPQKVRDELHHLAPLHQDLIEDFQGVRHLSLVDVAVQLAEHPGIHRAEDLQRLVIGKDLVPVVERVALVEKAESVAHGAVRRARDITERFVLHAQLFRVRDFPQAPLDRLRGQPAEIIPLAPGQNSDRQLIRLRRRQDEDRVGGRLFQCLEERVESGCRQHVDFVDDVDAVFSLRRGVRHLVDDIPDIVDAVVGSRVHLHDIQARVRADRPAGGTLAAGTPVERILAVHRLGEDLRDRGLARSPRPAEKIAVRDPSGDDLVLQRADNDVPSPHVLEGAGPVFSV